MKCMNFKSKPFPPKKKTLSTSSSPSTPNKYTFPSLINSSSSLHHVQKLHAIVLSMGIHSDPFIACALVATYSRHGLLSHALNVFDRLPHRDAALWNSAIDACIRHGCRTDGLALFRRMRSSGTSPDGFSLSIVLGVSPESASRVHAYGVKTALDVETALVDAHMKCARIDDACRVFDATVRKNAFAWDAMVGGLSRNGLWERSLGSYETMRLAGFEPGSATFTAVLAACSMGGTAGFGRRVHCDAVKTGFERDPYVRTSLVGMYARCAFIDDAYGVFRVAPDEVIELWNSMISAFVCNDRSLEALGIYNTMRWRSMGTDCFTILNVLSAIESINFGRSVHAELIKRPTLINVATQTSLLTMYARCGSIEDARAVFDSIIDKDLIAWSSMITGFCHYNRFFQALDLCKQMRAEGLNLDIVIVVNLISACADEGSLFFGRPFHGLVIRNGAESDFFIGSALIDMYAKCGSIESAKSVFLSTRNKNLVVWNSMISGCARNAQPELSICLFSQLPKHGMAPDSASVTSALVAISSLSALRKGKTIHGHVIRHETNPDQRVQNALIDMYVKCACFDYARRVFNVTPTKDTVAWNSMINGYGTHGRCEEAMELFEEMKATGTPPDEVTFLALVSACAHTGLVEEGLAIFESMMIAPRIEHYVKLVDMLGKSGRVREACEVIKAMPMEVEEGVWSSLLSGCQGMSAEVGEVAAREVMKGGKGWGEVVKMYGMGGLWGRVKEVRVWMRERGVRRRAGCSWIEVGEGVEVFFSGGPSSARAIEVDFMLGVLEKIMRGDDYDDEEDII
ncbi:Pentatricopeptide repeat-containing protein [Acorus gramineus]|uniref:Pentatricopeptide repeat-containing protein n=1 Tax=Acorus gramineus TaxID=55184 RepID=A0AAV9B3I9_ACOGR|nr:Pentatricopeptide repeat-containing protein [Acorus gramineus]